MNALTHQFTPATNPLFIPWTEDPEAQMLLARCGANPPRGEWKRTVYVQTADEWFEYTGPLADRLTALRDEYGYRALMHYHDANEYGPFEAWCRSASVGEAIEAAIAGVSCPTVEASVREPNQRLIDLLTQDADLTAPQRHEIELLTGEVM